MSHDHGGTVASAQRGRLRVVLGITVAILAVEIVGGLLAHSLVLLADAWTVTSCVPVLSAHVVVDDGIFLDGGAGAVLDRLAECLTGHFDLEHCTFRLEPAAHQDHEHPVHR
jgi:Co/Zn/Cd efflux system component